MRIPVFLLAMLVAAPALAQDDPRLRTVLFRPGTVYTLRVVPGYVATVVLSPDERIESVAIGNSGAWDVSPSKSGDHLFVRPLGNSGPTNTEIVTDSRHYSILLQTAFDGDPEATFTLRFTYGEQAAPEPTGPMQPIADATAVTVPVYYRIKGDRLARPLAVTDDGKQTLFTFDKTMPLPAIYAVDEQGHETLVTIRQSNDDWSIDRVWPKYVLRVGKAKAHVLRSEGQVGR